MTAKEGMGLSRRRVDSLPDFFEWFIVNNFMQKLAYHEVHTDPNVSSRVDDYLWHVELLES